MQVIFSKKVLFYRVKLIEAIARRIQEVMQKKGITQYALCKKIAISESCLYNIFYGRQQDIPTSRLLLICDGLGITMQEFFDSSLFNSMDID